MLRSSWVDRIAMVQVITTWVLAVAIALALFSGVGRPSRHEPQARAPQRTRPRATPVMLAPLVDVEVPRQNVNAN